MTATVTATTTITATVVATVVATATPTDSVSATPLATDIPRAIAKSGGGVSVKQQRLVVAGEGDKGGGGRGWESTISTEFTTVYFHQTEVK
jgi:hypothetical protein